MLSATATERLSLHFFMNNLLLDELSSTRQRAREPARWRRKLRRQLKKTRVPAAEIENAKPAPQATSQAPGSGN